MSATTLAACYLGALNLLGLLFMGIDKWKAKKGAFRIPESTLFIIALCGGSIGSIVGMYLFRHKTRHWTFIIGMPLILILQIAGLVWLFFYSGFTFRIL